MKKLSLLISFAVIAISLFAQLPPEFGRYKRVNTTNEKAQQDLIASVVENGAFIFSQIYIKTASFYTGSIKKIKADTL